MADVSESLWKVSIIIPTSNVDIVADWLSHHIDSLSVFEVDEGKTWNIEGFCQGPPNLSLMETELALLAQSHRMSPAPPLHLTRMPPRDWLKENFASFQPIVVGRYFVHGSHYADAPPSGKIPIRIDAATAFGSGDHGTTGGCLQALEDLRDILTQDSRVLDMGCGSAILAIASAKTWECACVAVDIDPESVRVAGENARYNGVAEKIVAAYGDGYNTPVVRQYGPYDLILANILARPLCEMAPDLARWLKPGGTAILSGLLNSQEQLVVEAHTSQGLDLRDKIHRGEWLTLVMSKKP